MPRVRIPVPLRPLTDGQSHVTVEGSTAGEVLQNLLAAHPGLRDQIMDGDDLASSTYESMNLLLGAEDVRELGGWDTPVPTGAVLKLIRSWPAAISGGKQWNQPVGAPPPE